jgi:hypothetical protein
MFQIRMGSNDINICLIVPNFEVQVTGLFLFCWCGFDHRQIFVQVVEFFATSEESSTRMVQPSAVVCVV